MWPAPFRWDSTRSLWLGAALAVGLLLTTLATAQSVVWDDFNTHVWTIGIEDSKDMQWVERGWIRDGARRVLHIQYVPGEATSNYILAFTNLLSPQTLSGVSEIRFELKWDQRPAQAALKLEANTCCTRTDMRMKA
jgi:quinol-cytochrome oxidoreductase complex cytochrome b subunit